MSLFQIKHRLTGAVIFSLDTDSLRSCVEAAVKARANLAGANLARANLAGANLADAYLADANLAGANLARAHLADAYLADAYLADAHLADAYLADAYLARANLARAYLADAYLADAYLADAYLADAYLARAYLADAYLADAYLADAYLADARNVPAHEAPTEPYDGTPSQARYAERAAKFRERNPAIPVVESLDAKILRVVESGAGKLRMDQWHTCTTTHCRAGWAVHLAGEAGYKLEKKHGAQYAGTMIYRASTGRVPHFFASEERALEDIREQAALQAQP